VLTETRVCVFQNPVEVTGDTGVDSVVRFQSAAFAEGDDPDDGDLFVHQGDEWTCKD
jgi:hypothetical protein